MHSRQREGESRRRDHAKSPRSGAALSALPCVSADKHLGGSAGAGNRYVHQVRFAGGLCSPQRFVINGLLECFPIGKLRGAPLIGVLPLSPPPPFWRLYPRVALIKSPLQPIPTVPASSAGADWGDIHRASPLWMPEPTIVSPDAEMVTAYGGAGAGATVSSGYRHSLPPAVAAEGLPFHFDHDRGAVHVPVMRRRGRGRFLSTPLGLALAHFVAGLTSGCIASRLAVWVHLLEALLWGRRRYDDHKPRTPPPDLPSLLLDSRICYLGA